MPTWCGVLPDEKVARRTGIQNPTSGPLDREAEASPVTDV
jgi:hypothetical protein